MEIEIQDKKPNKETEEERKARLYQNGNVIEKKGYLYMVEYFNGEWKIVGIGNAHTSIPYDLISVLADDTYENTDKLVTKLIAEVEEY